MIVLVTGTAGFLGESIAQALRLQGHEVVCVAGTAGKGHGPPLQSDPAFRWADVDFYKAQDPADWWAALQGVEVVINAEDNLIDPALYQSAQARIKAPHALFRACVQANVQRVVQLSVPGAHQHSRNPLLASKHGADLMLLSLPLDAVVVQVAPIFGLHDRLSAWVLAVASLPCVPVSGKGNHTMRPLHVNDFLHCIVMLAQPRLLSGRRLHLVGGRVLSMRQYLLILRQNMGLRPARVVALPGAWVKGVAKLGSALGKPFNTESWHALRRRGEGEDVSMTRHLLGREPRDPAGFVPALHQDGTRAMAKLVWLLPLLRLCLASVWLGCGLGSLSEHATSPSLAVLHGVGPVSDGALPWLYGAAALDVFFSVETLVRPRRLLWLLQMAVLAAYTLWGCVWLATPAMQPAAGVLKNLSMFALAGALASLSKK